MYSYVYVRLQLSCDTVTVTICDAMAARLAAARALAGTA